MYSCCSALLGTQYCYPQFNNFLCSQVRQKHRKQFTENGLTLLTHAGWQRFLMYNLIMFSQINLRNEFIHHQNKESNCKKSHGVKI